jgi:hypothetical protein
MGFEGDDDGASCGACNGRFGYVVNRFPHLSVHLTGSLLPCSLVQQVVLVSAYL